MCFRSKVTAVIWNEGLRLLVVVSLPHDPRPTLLFSLFLILVFGLGYAIGLFGHLAWNQPVLRLSDCCFCCYGWLMCWRLFQEISDFFTSAQSHVCLLFELIVFVNSRWVWKVTMTRMYALISTVLPYCP